MAQMPRHICPAAARELAMWQSTERKSGG